LANAQKNQTLALAGSWETLDAVVSSIGEIVRYGLPDDYFATYPAKVRSLQLSELSSVAVKVVQPDRMVWVVVGDRAKIEPSIRELGWGDVRVLDADGNASK
jgi:zinc protease